MFGIDAGMWVAGGALLLAAGIAIWASRNQGGGGSGGSGSGKSGTRLR